jgi:hypothetical protein
VLEVLLSLWLLSLQRQGAVLLPSIAELAVSGLLWVAYVHSAGIARPLPVKYITYEEAASRLALAQERSKFARQLGLTGRPPGGWNTDPEAWAAWVARSELEKTERRRLAGQQQEGEAAEVEDQEPPAETSVIRFLG